ncbi:MAG: hypothetical protein VBE63_24120 [Lamprobacter sp.]|uniref:hypothetical protein n=1 Tax=Lamprobacter sp. TaxID=3100796 RepID=UPI002B25913B|nr:hypothetical protein [Lamprobacter sp.]MEA3643002.1 hypothetical protein [Lamprobacter sp.]
MTTAISKTPDAYLQRLDDLLNQIDQWSSAKGLNTQRYRVNLNEEAYGSYPAQGLRLSTAEGDPLGTIIPVGASIIGAKGRVDFEGTIDQAILVDWDVGGPLFETSVRAGNDVRATRQPIYRGVDEAGWYWVESRQLSRAHKLDERLFFDLLLMVSDYDLRG